jgi:hypothetical protein
MNVPRETLRRLADDVNRLLAAGAAVAPGDAGLRRRGAELHAVAGNVPALDRVVAAVERVTAAAPDGAAVPLLDLVLLTRQALTALAETGAGGGVLAPLPPGGPWVTATPAAEVGRLADLVVGDLGRKEWEEFRAALDRGVVADLRLVGPLLTALATASTQFVREDVAARALPAFGPVIAPELLAGLAFRGDDDYHRQESRLLAICATDPAFGVRVCRDLLARGSARMKALAIDRMAEVAPPEEAARVGREYVVSENPYVRSAAMRTLKKVGPAAADAVGVLVPLLAGPNQFVQDDAARVLAEIGPAAVLALVAALRDERTSEHASWALRWMEPPPAAAVPAVIEILRDPGSPVFKHALQVLRMGPAARDAVPTLIETLRHPDPDVRRPAVYILKGIGEDSAAVRAALRERLGDEDRYVREYAAEALATLAGPTPEVLRLLWAGQVGVRLAVVEGLGGWAGRSPAAADALREAARDTNKKIAAAAAAALKRPPDE